MIPNIRCLTKACDDLGIKYEFLDKNNNLVRILHTGKSYFFANSTTPFNDETISHICKDKEFTYHILKNKVKIGKTIGFLDPEVSEDYKEYLHESSLEKIVETIRKEFSFPVIVKKNTGAQGVNVFKCNDGSEVLVALKTIYDKNSKQYDYVALAQEFIDIKEEYRVIVSQSEILLVYLKDNSNAVFVGNLSPLHWEGAKAVVVENTELLDQLQKFIDPLFNEMNIQYCGLDIAIDTEGKPWLIEINSKPLFKVFVRDNGEEPLVEMYKRMLKQILPGY